jgi:phytanoyl-CoA hydroxylase
MIETHNDNAFSRNGFAVARDTVSAQLLTRLKDAVQKVQDSVSILPPHLLERLTLERDLSADRRNGVEAAAVGDSIFIISDPVAFDEIFWELLSQPAILSAIQDAIGSHDLAAHFMNVTIKHPRFGRSVAWHRDYMNDYACPATSQFVRVMLCLDGMSEYGGATQFIPGTHYLDDAMVTDHRPPVGWQPTSSEIVKLCCNPGDLVLIHPKVLHGSGVNTSSLLRRNIVLQAGDAGAPLRNIPAREAITGYRLQEVLEN